MEHEILIASDPSLEKLVVEIFINGIQWAQISHEDEPYVVSFFRKGSRGLWELEYGYAIDLLRRAEARYSELGYTPRPAADKPYTGSYSYRAVSAKEGNAMDVIYEDETWVRISSSPHKRISLVFYEHPDKCWWELEYYGALSALREGADRLGEA